jgi:hypothetical protein
MVRILTTEGASAISAFEDGLIPTPKGISQQDYWWELAEKNSEVYIRRIRIFGSGIKNRFIKQNPFAFDTLRG